MIKEQHFFFGKLDTDTSIELISKENQSYALNIIRGPEKVGKAKTFYGTSPITYTAPAGDNKCIGTGINIQSNSIIGLIYNSTGNHQIIEVFPSTKTVEVIMGPFTGFDTSWLGFDESRLITHVNVFDGNLTFSEGGDVGPYHIDINAAKGFMNGDASTAEKFVYPAASFSTIESRIQTVRAIKYLPSIKPVLTYISDSSKKTNYLKYKTWQLAYRYIYFDNSYSALSPYSDLVVPPKEDTSIGTNGNISINNGLRMVINTGHANVKNIEICFRNGNTGQFYTIDKLIRKYDKDNQPTSVGNYQSFTFTWYGEDVGYAIGVDELLNYDAIPYRAQTQSFLHNNRLVYGNYDVDYNSTEIDVSISQTNTAYGSKPNVYGFDLETSSGGSASDTIRIPATATDISEGDVIYFIVQDSIDASYLPDDTWDYPYSYTVTAADIAGYPTTLRDSLLALGANNPVTFSAGATNREVTVTPPPGGARFAKFFSFKCYKVQDKVLTWKKGARPEFSITYHDECGRMGPGNTSLDSRVYIPWYSESRPNRGMYNDNGASGILTTNWDIKLQLEINHPPPSWAKYYQIGYGGNGISFYIQGKGEIISANDELDSEVTIMSVEAFVDNIISNKLTSYNYEFQEGDRIRLISDKTDTYDTYQDHKVLSFNTGDKTLTLETGSIGLFEGTFEIYRLTPETKSTVHYGISDLIPIVDGFHTGGTQDQTAVQPAIQNINGGDTYIYDRFTEDIVTLKGTGATPDLITRTNYSYKQESMHVSDFYDSNDFSRGKLILVDNNSISKTLFSELIHGGVYAKDSNLNEVFKFNPLNTTQVDYQNGAITSMRTIARTLKVLQEYNLSSVYIEQAYINQGSNRVLAFTDSVFGYTEPSPDNWGTKNPESVYVNDRHLFYYDTENRSIVRDAPNGAIVISKYGATTWFRDEINVQDFVHLYYDDYNSLLICTVGERTISFIDDGSNRWNGFHSFVPDMANSINRHLIAFENGLPYIFEKEANYGEYFGIQYPSVIRVTANENPSDTKVYHNIEQKSSGVWSSPEDGDISVNNGDMISRLMESKYRKKDGMYYAEFLRDLNTPNKPANEVILSGRRLTGNHLTIDLQITSDVEEEIFSVTIDSVPSKVR